MKKKIKKDWVAEAEKDYKDMTQTWNIVMLSIILIMSFVLIMAGWIIIKQNNQDYAQVLGKIRCSEYRGSCDYYDCLSNLYDTKPIPMSDNYNQRQFDNKIYYRLMEQSCLLGEARE